MAIDDALKEMNEAHEAYNSIPIATADIARQPWSVELVMFLSAAVLLFIVISLLLSTALLWRRKYEAPEVLKIFGILSIVGLSALLLITGFSNEQLTPIVGLFGAIAGYLLGKDIKVANSNT